MAVIELASRRHDGGAFFHFSQEANHRISNQLAVIASIVQMQASSLARGPEMLSSKEVRGMLRETAGKIASIAHLHRKLAQPENVEQIELGEYLIECSAILASSLAPKGQVGFVQRLDKDCFVRADQAQSVGLIINEVVTNAVKHAHPTGLPVEIRICCRRVPGHHVEIEIQDDGVGLPEGLDWKSGGGIGFRMIRTLAENLKAEATFESDSLGTSFSLMVPCGAKPD